MTEFTVDGLLIETQDLGSINPESKDDGRMFNHDGSSELSLVGGGVDRERGFYVWNSSAGGWSPAYENADKLDGMESGEFIHRDGSLPIQGNLDLDNNRLLNTDSVESGVGKLLLNSNHVSLKALSGGANVQLEDSNGLLLLNAQESGDVDIPNGILSEQGARVATRTWTEANADVPNADYADNAGAVDGDDASAFLHVSGDQMEGVLDVGGFNIKDGGTTKYDGTAGVFVQSALGGPASSLNAYPLQNSDLSNSSVTLTAGNQLTGGGSVSLGGSISIDLSDGSGSGLDADTVDTYQGADLAALAENETVDGAWIFNVAPSVPAGSFGESELDFDEVPLSIPVTKWSDGLTDTEIFRIELSAGESLEVHRLEIQPKGGGDVTDLDVDVYDESAGTLIASTSDVASGSPLGSSSDGANCIVRLTNNSGSYQNAAIGGRLHIV